MKHVLIVEDDRSIRETLKEILELSGCKVSSASNGLNGLELIKSEHPDLVLCDICMPRLDGFELIEVVNALYNECRRPKFVFVTAKVEEYQLSRAKKLGAMAFIKKPFDHQTLLRVIEEIFVARQFENKSVDENKTNKDSSQPSASVA